VSAQAVTTTSTTTLSPARDARLIPYCVIAIAALGAALVAGQPALAALAAPFALALAFGLRRTTPVHVMARITLDTDQVLEGDLVTGRIELAWDGELLPHAMLHRLRGKAHSSAATFWSLPHTTHSLELPIALTATQWGRHPAGEVWLRLRAPFGMLTWTGRVATAPTLRVLPKSERLTRLLDPAEYRAVLGMHRSRRFGAGSEFAELRQYSPGDRLRDLNWAATARRRKPLVNAHHPELSGDVVIALDAFADGSTGSTEALARAARAAWALASIHLRSNDRVGLVGLGGSTRWLAPASGRRAQYRLLETLLGMGGEPSDLPRAERTRINVPAAALVVAITPLHERTTIGALQSWRAHGRMVAVVAVDTSDLLGDAASAGEVQARRLWRIELERRRRELTELGIPVVTLGADGRIGPVVSALRRARRAPVVRRR
jgi:uncharacterized protein (DUF58 family)